MARPLETPAGSESMARMRKESSWNLGDPGQSSLKSESTPTEWTIHREADAAVGVGPIRSTRSAGKPRTWGRDGAGWNACSEKHPLHAEVG
jgi:hypothetical protein